MTIKDKDIWDQYTRSVKPAAKKTIKHIKTKPEKLTVQKTLAQMSAEKVPTKLHIVTYNAAKNLSTAHTLERSREKQLRQGDIAIEAQLDMHGMTQTEAFDALASFIHAKTKSGKRYLLIITGKGRGGEGILRRNLQNWLSSLPEAKFILALRPAAPQHGGTGAFYLLLRKS